MKNAPRNRFYKLPDQLTLPDFLDPHQREGVQWILSRKNSYLAHAPGAGKTCQAIVASSFMLTRNLRGVFIVPPSLVENWRREIEKFSWLMYRSSPNICTIEAATSLNKVSAIAPLSNYIIVADTMIHKGWVQNILHKLDSPFIAIDEASRFKDAKSLRTVALFGGVRNKTPYPGILHHAEHVVLMDGSPMPNRPMELWAPLYALSPESIGFMDYYQFGFSFCGARQNVMGHWEFKGSSNEALLNQKITENFMHVVKEEALNHPERLRSITYINEDLRSQDHREWERMNIENPDITFRDISEDQSTGTLSTFRRELGISKIDWVAQYVSEHLRIKHESIIVFCWHREVAFALAEKLKRYDPGLILGGMSGDERELKFKYFQDGKGQLLIMNIQAGGRGHNLTRADRVIFAEYSWCDETNKQAEKRASRKGRDANLPVRCEYLAIANTIDEYILKALFTKEKRVEKVIQ